MPNWAGSDRKATLPPNWPTLRRQVFARDDHRCTILMKDGRRCRDKATDCDHIGDREDHSLENLRSICSWHHQRRSSQQGAAGRKPGYEARKRALYRKPETPPAHIDKEHAIPRPRRGF